MITSLTIENFKGHRSTTVELGRLTVLVGPNGAGKTSVLQALRCMGQLLIGTASDVFQGANEPSMLVRRGSNGPIQVKVAGTFDDKPWQVSFAIKFGVPAATGEIPWDFAYSWKPPGDKSTAGSGRDRKLGEREKNGAFWRALRAGGVFRFDPRQVAAPSYSDKETPSVDYDGANTASVLAAIKLSDDERFEAIVSGLRKLVPAVKRVRIRPARVLRRLGMQDTAGDHIVKSHVVMGHQIVFDFEGAADVPAPAVSEGTLVSLALLTVLHSENRPDLVLIDDIEQALHPVAQIALMKQLAGILESFEDVQIIATTHSPFILDGVAPEQVLVFFRRDDGDIVVKRLSEHPDAQRAKGTLSAGQIWTLDPESWVVEGNSSA
jgi:predicted ATPase